MYAYSFHEYLLVIYLLIYVQNTYILYIYIYIYIYLYIYVCTDV